MSQTIDRASYEARNTVTLALDEGAMVQALRHAFTNHDTVVQELLQNARRAGARQVDIHYDEPSRTLVVRDDGAGIADFNALLTVGRSGWSQQTCEEERPYGVGFLSALYAAAHVRVCSTDGTLAFDTDRALARQPLVIDTSERTESGTAVTLRGFEWKNATMSGIEMMCSGFALPVTFNRQRVTRADTLCCRTEGVFQTDVGTISLGHTPGSSIVAYLQGFRVYAEYNRWYDDSRSIVHLDSRRYRGRLPDRDKVVDEEQMLAEVRAAIRGCWEQRLEQMRMTLSPIEFCRQGHSIAKTLGRLDVFNDISVAPQSWFSVYSEPPRSEFEWSDSPRGTAAITDGFVSLEDVRNRKVLVADLASYWETTPGEEEQATNVQAQMAWAAKALLVAVSLDPGHWLHEHAAIHCDLPVSFRVIGEGRRESINTRMTHAQWGNDIAVCEAIELDAGELKATVTEAILWHDGAYWVPVDHEGERPSFDTATVQQGASYCDEHRNNDDDAHEDVATLNQLLRQMLATSPEDEVAGAMRAAIENYSDLRKLRCRIEIDDLGRVAVRELERIGPGADGEGSP